MITKHFAYWDDYWGQLFEDGDERFPSRIFGFHTGGRRPRTTGFAVVPFDGATFGYVVDGEGELAIDGLMIPFRGGHWFTTACGAELHLSAQKITRVVVAQRVGWKGVNAHGGPLEALGRLRYIDGCSDTLLVCPPLLGDPCLNHLHFPAGTDQTQHTHPSTRAGIVAAGYGQCITPDGEHELTPGRLFYIPRNGLHRFRTFAPSGMDVVAYHPDSDWGPTNEAHPMVNRTLVDGRKIDNTIGRHANAAVIAARLGGAA